MRRMMVIGAVAVCAMAVPAMAKDRLGYTSIAAGSLSEAETTLNAERAIFPERPELMLNLAAIYARTDRTAQARSLYDGVLSRDAVALELANGNSLSSHDVALRGLSLLNGAMAAR